MRSLRTKITAIPVAAILASLLAAALAGFFTVGQEVTQSSAEKMHLMSENARHELDAYLNDITQAEAITTHIATNTLDGMQLVSDGANLPASERTAEQTAHLDASMAAHGARVEEALGNIAGNTDGVAAYYYCIVPEISQAEHGFFYSRLGKVGFEQHEPLDASQFAPEDDRDRTWYFDTIAHGAPLWVGPYQDSELDGRLSVSYLTPIYRSGVLVGVLGMDILFQTMVEQIESLGVYDTGYACLLDEGGRILYHPEVAAGQMSAEEAQALFEGAFDDPAAASEGIYYEKGQKRWQMAYSTLSNGMRLVVTAPVSEVTASWNRLVSVVPLIGVVILGLFVPLTLLATGAVVKPLQKLTEAARHLASGDYDIELDYQAHDEVGELTDAFRQLRDHLQVYTSDLDSATFADEASGAKNRRAYDLYAAQVNDAIARATERDETQFAIAIFDCLDAERIRGDFGDEWGEACVATVCGLVCQVFMRSPVFRLEGDRLVVFLQGRNYANREELMCDFDILATDANAQAVEPWLLVHAAKGMATYRPQADKGVSDVFERALTRVEADSDPRQAETARKGASRT